MNNTKSISKSPKDFVLCKPAFQPTPFLARACTMDAAGAGEGIEHIARIPNISLNFCKGF